MAKANKTRRIGRNRNPEEFTDSIEGAEDLAKKFHGREPKDVYELDEYEFYPENLAKLGELEEITIYSLDGKLMIPIKFSDGVDLCGSGNNLYIVGGNQEIDVEALREQIGLNGESPSDRQYVDLGDVCSIVYFTDKHHLQGGNGQKKGASYEHYFCEQDKDGSGASEFPKFVYDRWNGKILLVGGSYEIRPEGIWN